MPSSSTRNTRPRQLPLVLGEGRKEVAGLIQALLSPASADADSLARALLACHRSLAAPILAALLHHHVHGSEICCPTCADPTPLLATAMAGAVEEAKINEELVKHCHAAYVYGFGGPGFVYPHREFVFLSAAVLLLEGLPDRAARLARLGHNAGGEHEFIECPRCYGPLRDGPQA